MVTVEVPLYTGAASAVDITSAADSPPDASDGAVESGVAGVVPRRLRDAVVRFTHGPVYAG
jgi:hypothetical protein